MKNIGKRLVVIMLMSMMVILSITACSRSKEDTEEYTPSTSTSKSSTSSTKRKATEQVTDQETPEESEEATEEIAEETEEVVAEEEASEDGTEKTEEAEEHLDVKSNSSAIGAFAKLLSGNTEYLSGNINPGVDASLRTDLATNGQHPYAIVITCSDSRVPAELIFNAGLGEIFVIRTAGNVVSDFEIGSVEYGAEHLGSPLVFVLGHTNCGAVTAATEGGEAGGSIQAIVNEIAPSVAKAKETASGEQILSKAIELNVSNSISKIRQSPIMKELEEEGKVAIIGGIYDIHTGSVKVLE